MTMESEELMEMVEEAKKTRAACLFVGIEKMRSDAFRCQEFPKMASPERCLRCFDQLPGKVP